MNGRHMCVICGMKRYSVDMEVAFTCSWVCKDKKCNNHPDIKHAIEIINIYKKLKKVRKAHIFGR